MDMGQQAGWKRFLSAYYVINGLLIAAYIYIRLGYEYEEGSKYSRLSGPGDLFAKERQAFPALLVVVGVKFWKQVSVDGFLSEFFFYAKLVLSLMLYYMDVRVLVCFLTVWLLLFLLSSQPMYRGPSELQDFTPASLKSTVLDANTESSPNWVVEFYAPWSPQCVHLALVVAELSQIYSSDHLKFGRLEISKWPALAKQFNVNTSGVGQQLPTLVVFEKGKEVVRIPQVFPDGSVAQGNFRKGDIVTALNLEGRSNGDVKPEAAKSGPSKKKR